MSTSTESMRESPAFYESCRRRNRLRTLLTLLALGAYIGFVLCAALAPDWFGSAVGASSPLSVGFACGVLTMVLLIGLQGIYLLYSPAASTPPKELPVPGGMEHE